TRNADIRYPTCASSRPRLLLRSGDPAEKPIRWMYVTTARAQAKARTRYRTRLAVAGAVSRSVSDVSSPGVAVGSLMVLLHAVRSAPPASRRPWAGCRHHADASAQPDRAQIGAGPLGNRQRLVERRGIHILLDRRPAVVIGPAQRVAKGEEV